MQSEFRQHQINSIQKSLISQIRWKASYMKPALQRIANRVLKDPEGVKSITIKDLAIQCQVSESTVTRFIREIDIGSFQQFKVRIAEEIISNRTQNEEDAIDNRQVYEGIDENDDTSKIVEKISWLYKTTINDTKAQIHPAEVEAAVTAIEQADGLAFFALGMSMLSVENALLRFMRVGKECQFFRDSAVREISTATIGLGKLAIAISNSGRSISTVDALKTCKERGAVTMCITSFDDSPIVKYADIKLFTPTVTGSAGTADYHESMVSKIAQLQVIDMLYAVYATRNMGTSIQTLHKTSSVTVKTRY